MRLEWLEDILAVAATGSFSEAAERRRLTQSAFSRRIRSIEDYVGVELFDRSRKPVHLTATTLAQREQIAALTGMLRQLVEDLRHGDRKSGKRIVVASQHALTTSLAPALIGYLRGRDDDVFVRLRSANLDECFAQLLARQADLAIVYRLPGHEHPVRGDHIQSLTIGTDRLIPVISSDAAAEVLAGLDAGVLRHIAYPTGVFLGQVMNRLIWPRLEERVRPQAYAETALTLAALEMAMAGTGVAWVPESLIAARLADGSMRSLCANLPDCTLDVTAVRFAFGTPGPTDLWVWAQLAEMVDMSLGSFPGNPNG
ncbi:LysR family transcriptional regulator [Frigidibacter sp. ROC022]|uniref:LysR family transcriptional regulator n=1 Tax=Frigidibacter sp. ROC022 TaxID=2971796 RepID=UPI00215AE86C|nr:LysR family transcriptional regulator [Frigidibacter sp. ROC022]MCR8724686.1 LysR family transcriptional regulator [Frigidibacter sp. ROC022]